VKSIAYIFPGGFAKEAARIYAWLRHYNLTPSWGPSDGSESVIMLPENEISALVEMQKGNPDRFGNPKKYPIRAKELSMNRTAVAKELMAIVKGLMADSVELRLRTLEDGDTPVLRLPIVKRGTMSSVNNWARAQGFKFVKDSTIYGGHWTNPQTGDAYLIT
jgi:hypothetical protein